MGVAVKAACSQPKNFYCQVKFSLAKIFYLIYFMIKFFNFFYQKTSVDGVIVSQSCADSSCTNRNFSGIITTCCQSDNCNSSFKMRFDMLIFVVLILAQYCFMYQDINFENFFIYMLLICLFRKLLWFHINLYKTLINLILCV